jgi:hypothetical protein
MSKFLVNYFYPQAAPKQLSWLFLRGLALIYFSAFASMAVQIEGLIGEQGLLPIKTELARIARYFPQHKYKDFPTLFWFDASDQALVMACYVGITAALFLLINCFDRLALVLCYGLYLSITVAGQDFTAFQWDALLLETGFLAIVLTGGSPICVFLYRWLIARFMLMGGIVKLASGDAAWANLTALSYHYQTEPIPSPLAYYAYYWPLWFHKLCVAGVLLIELVIPFFVFLPRRFRLIAAWSFILLQSSIILSGNYNFFNLLAILLCLFLFDEKDVEKIVPLHWLDFIKTRQKQPGRAANVLATVWLAVVMLFCAGQLWIYHVRRPLIKPLTMVMEWSNHFYLVNNYGPFAIMTTARPEIIVQGSDDGRHWQNYLFKYKPVELAKPLSWNIPHQPRLDWQMWFAAMESPAPHSWFANFMQKLEQGSPQVLSLLDHNPFPEKPPAYVRALAYRYRYTTPEQRAATGNIWQRDYLGVYWPPG